MEKYAKLLRNVEHFRKLTVADLRFVINAGQLKRFQKGSVIFHETEPSAGMFVLFTGKVHLCKLSPAGQVQIISIIEPVIMFNELTAIDRGPNPFTAIAEQACLTWNIGHDAFHSLVMRYPDPAIGLAMMQVLARRTRLLIDRCEDLSFRSVLARTAKVLLEMSDNGTKTIDRGKYPIKNVAANIATVPETLSRSFSVLSERGLIDCTRKTISILQPVELSVAAQLEPYPLNNFAPPLEP
ncbi:MAG: cyclic nucleotide-binding domain-containing protein [Anaerolineales bacterium]|nr:cyclic nucleotide-binding domain-containing protein [Anaerolineales bacterium]